MKYENTIEYAKQQDTNDPLKNYREKFYFPMMHGRETVYFTGNSLGLQPKATQDYVLNELEDWAVYGVEGHFHARNPWMPYHEPVAVAASSVLTTPIACNGGTAVVTVSATGGTGAYTGTGTFTVNAGTDCAARAHSGGTDCGNRAARGGRNCGRI